MIEIFIRVPSSLDTCRSPSTNSAISNNVWIKAFWEKLMLFSFFRRLPYEGIFGGVSALSTHHFVKVNGFSNLFWGWGGEDDDMYNRIRYYNLSISRYPGSVARYTMLSHKKAEPNPIRFDVMRNGAQRSKTDGLNVLKYNRLGIQMKTLYIHILVDIKPSE